jgi:tubulin polyglutamylase TTLL5
MKPVGAGASRGRGISVVKDISGVQYGAEMVIQKYVERPLLLDGFKFDLRTYVLVTSFSPLEAHLYTEGFARLSTQRYTLAPDQVGNDFVHLTNSSIQKHSDQYAGSDADNKVLMSHCWRQLQQRGIDTSAMWSKMQEVILKCLFAVQDDIAYQPNAFELFGFDIIFEDCAAMPLRPGSGPCRKEKEDPLLACMPDPSAPPPPPPRAWVLEVNASPSLARETALDRKVKNALVRDVLRLIDTPAVDRVAVREYVNKLAASTALPGAASGGGGHGTVGKMNALQQQGLATDMSKMLKGGARPRAYGDMPPGECVGDFQRLWPAKEMEHVARHFRRGTKR